MGAKYVQESDLRIWVQHIFRNLVPFFGMPSASGYMGAKYVQESGPRFLNMSHRQKGSHFQNGGGSVVRRVFTWGGYNYEI